MVIIVSDGLDTGDKEVTAAETLKAVFGVKFAIYAIQIGSSKRGHALLERVSSAGGSGDATSIPSATAYPV